jgi:ferrous iron transport protein B
MATRTIENRKSKLITMAIIPFMSCSGRLPIFILLSGIFFGSHAALVLLGIYLLGILMAIISAKVMSKFVKDDDLPFVMELPPYRVPTGKAIFRHTWEKGKQYLEKMATTILLFSILIWFLGYFPNHNKYGSVREQKENSYIGYIGKGIEPIMKPLGFNWKMGVGILSGIGAKELIVSTMGVMYSGEGQEAGTDETTVSSGKGTSALPEDTSLQRGLKNDISTAGALAYMVFILLYFPCIATFIAIKNESGGWKWAIGTCIYTIMIAWIMAFATYHLFLLF